MGGATSLDSNALNNIRLINFEDFEQLGTFPQLGSKFKLCVDGIKYVKNSMAPGMKHCYIWLDFGCIDQNGNPAGELKMLDKIVQISDIIYHFYSTIRTES